MARSMHPDSAKAAAIRALFANVLADSLHPSAPPFLLTFLSRKEAEAYRFQIYAYLEGLRRNVKNKPIHQIDLIQAERFTIGIVNTTLVFNDQTKGPMGMFFAPVYEERLAIARALETEHASAAALPAASSKKHSLPKADEPPQEIAPVPNDEEFSYSKVLAQTQGANIESENSPPISNPPSPAAQKDSKP